MIKDEQIKIIADSLLSSFLPKDASVTELSFNFTVPPNHTYKVWYEKNKTVWKFKKFEKVQIQ